MNEQERQAKVDKNSADTAQRVEDSRSMAVRSRALLEEIGGRGQADHRRRQRDRGVADHGVDEVPAEPDKAP